MHLNKTLYTPKYANIKVCHTRFYKAYMKALFRILAEWIPLVYGIRSAGIRNLFRRATEYL